MKSRRSFIAAGLALSLSGRAFAATPEASPDASPQATPAGAGWRVTGEGVLASPQGEPAFRIDLTARGGEIEGTFTLTVFPADGTEWLVEGSEYERIGPVSEMSPHITRIAGYCTLNDAGETPFILDLTKRQTEDEPDSLSFASGAAAAPFLGMEVKLGCDCGPFGISFEGEFVEGGFEVEQDA